MTRSSRFVLICVALCLIFVVARRGRQALQPARPADMPAAARFSQSGYDLTANEPKGEWVACQAHTEQAADWCRVTDARGVVVYEGEMLPLATGTPLPDSMLAVGPVNPDHLWTTGPAEAGPIPVIPLISGELLVPVADRLALISRWKEHPEELQAITAAE